MSAFLMAVNLVGVHRKIGDEVSAGEPLVTLHYNGDDRLEEAVRLAAEACEIQNGKAAPRRLVKTVIGEEEVSS